MNNSNKYAVKPTSKISNKKYARKGLDKTNRNSGKTSKEETTTRRKGRVLKSQPNVHNKKNKVNQKNILNVVKRVCGNRGVCTTNSSMHNLMNNKPSSESIIYIGTVPQFKCETVIDLTKSLSNESLLSSKSFTLRLNNKNEVRCTMIKDKMRGVNNSDQSSEVLTPTTSNDVNNLNIDHVLESYLSQCKAFRCAKDAHELSREDIKILETALSMEESVMKMLDLGSVSDMNDFVDVNEDINAMYNMYNVSETDELRK